MVVELDGSQHCEPNNVQYDLQRTQYLNSIGFHVLRFSNLDVKNNLSGVCQVIDQTVKQIVPINDSL